MISGYVYILINESMPGLIKIGRTIRDTRERARELSSTGVPTPFQVAFELFTEDCETLERTVQHTLDEFRVSTNREFFRYPLAKAINLVQELRGSPSDPDSIFAAEEVLDRLREIFPGSGDLREEIVSVRIAQTRKRVWLEITDEHQIQIFKREHVLKHQTIRRLDLGNLFHLGAGQKPEQAPAVYSPDRPIGQNVARFLASGGIGFAELAHAGDFPADALLLTKAALQKLQDENPEWYGVL